MSGKTLGEEALSRVPGQGTRGRQPLPRVSCPDTRERASSPSAFPGTRGRIFVFLSFNGVGGVNRQVTCFFAECRSSPSVALGEDGLCLVLLFTECQDLCGTRKNLSSPSAIIPRVQHSGKILFPECPIFCTRGSQRHSGNFASPVVSCYSSTLQKHVFGESLIGEDRKGLKEAKGRPLTCRK